VTIALKKKSSKKNGFSKKRRKRAMPLPIKNRILKRKEPENSTVDSKTAVIFFINHDFSLANETKFV